MSAKISVIICSYNPNTLILERVISSLRSQSLELASWELIVIDNNSDVVVSEWLDLSWHPEHRIIKEKKKGLSNARIRGVEESSYEILAFVDDDNILDNSFLKNTLDFAIAYPFIGCFGGKSIPQFETTPPDWFFETGIDLGCQDFGDETKISNFAQNQFKLNSYPDFAPIGTGMIIRKKAFDSYILEAKESPTRLAFGRHGTSLSSGEDNDIILTIIKNGWEIAYVPKLIVTHYIPKKRYSLEYLKKMAFESNKSWVKALEIHHINPWQALHPISLKLRQIKAYFELKAWENNLNYVKWRAACGKLKGLSEIYKR